MIYNNDTQDYNREVSKKLYVVTPWTSMNDQLSLLNFLVNSSLCNASRANFMFRSLVHKFTTLIALTVYFNNLVRILLIYLNTYLIRVTITSFSSNCAEISLKRLKTYSFFDAYKLVDIRNGMSVFWVPFAKIVYANQRSRSPNLMIIGLHVTWTKP